MKKSRVLGLMITMGMMAAMQTSACAADDVQLTYWYWADTPEQSELMQSIVKEYNETNTMNVTVNAEENAWNGGAYVEDMYVAVAGGGGPDISTFRASGASMYNNGGYLLNLTDYVNDWEDKDAIPETYWNLISESTATDGEYYLMPWTCETLYVYYRPHLIIILVTRIVRRSRILRRDGENTAIRPNCACGDNGICRKEDA